MNSSIICALLRSSILPTQIPYLESNKVVRLKNLRNCGKECRWVQRAVKIDRVLRIEAEKVGG